MIRQKHHFSRTAEYRDDLKLFFFYLLPPSLQDPTPGRRTRPLKHHISCFHAQMTVFLLFGFDGYGSEDTFPSSPIVFFCLSFQSVCKCDNLKRFSRDPTPGRRSRALEHHISCFHAQMTVFLLFGVDVYCSKDTFPSLPVVFLCLSFQSVCQCDNLKRFSKTSLPVAFHNKRTIAVENPAVQIPRKITLQFPRMGHII
ncbi:hypothetical protein CDAR_373571 [Caerostris darwini]|uniref:Uncharacterized protein n=1 Tax=Caerostris darwini TaxID=1538125 RepID=A0AAV4QL00_9ARAC|nr:hypothetical protein CDAR_373571 [Caerostris darwini]